MKKEKSVRKAEFQAALFRQLKSLIVPFIILAIILIGVLVISFSQGEAEPEEVVRVNGYEGEETEITLENDKLLFSMNSLTTQFSVTMKETGETWTSNPECRGPARGGPRPAGGRYRAHRCGGRPPCGRRWPGRKPFLSWPYCRLCRWL